MPILYGGRTNLFYKEFVVKEFLTEYFFVTTVSSRSGKLKRMESPEFRRIYPEIIYSLYEMKIETAQLPLVDKNSTITKTK